MTAAPPATTRGPRASWRTLLVLLVLVVGVVVAVATATGPSSPESARYDAGSGRLAFTLERFDGGQLDSTDLLGTPVVLNGYASWCTVCRREMPDFEAVHRSAGGKVAIVGFNPQTNDSDAAQARLVRETGVTYPTVRDPDDRLLRLFNPNGGLPVTVFVDADGVVRHVHRGLLTERMLREQIHRTLGVEV